MNEPGTGLLPGLLLGVPGTVGNSQCTVNGVGSAAGGGGNSLTFTLSLTFAALFSGNRVFYLAA